MMNAARSMCGWTRSSPALAPTERTHVDPLHVVDRDQDRAESGQCSVGSFEKPDRLGRHRPSEGEHINHRARHLGKPAHQRTRRRKGDTALQLKPVITIRSSISGSLTTSLSSRDFPEPGSPTINAAAGT
jgi:hypothetical protein